MFPKLLTVQEVAKMFRMNTLTVYEYVRTGKLPAVKIGRSYRILEADLYIFIKESKVYAK
jgi:excisionase family DNA binding protein